MVMLESKNWLASRRRAAGERQLIKSTNQLVCATNYCLFHGRVFRERKGAFFNTALIILGIYSTPTCTNKRSDKLSCILQSTKINTYNARHESLSYVCVYIITSFLNKAGKFSWERAQQDLKVIRRWRKANCLQLFALYFRNSKEHIQRRHIYENSLSTNETFKERMC